MDIEGQLNREERRLLSDAVLEAANMTNVLEVGTWLGGGSTAHILRALQERERGHLWGIEADKSIYNRMVANLQAMAPEAIARFTPLFGRSQDVIPKWLSEQREDFKIDLVFLDGGNNPLEQITEFRLLDTRIPTGGILMTHDAKLRKGKWLVPYISRLDNWESKLHDVSAEGLFFAEKTALDPSPKSLRAARSHLRRMRLEPAEIAAALLPAKICGAILAMLPRHVASKLAHGRI
jgi:predicted O-methyltransferase YrrM